MTRKPKMHFEEVPVEIVQKIAEKQIASQTQAAGSERFRAPTVKGSSKRRALKVRGGGTRKDS